MSRLYYDSRGASEFSSVKVKYMKLIQKLLRKACRLARSSLTQVIIAWAKRK